MDLRIIKNFHIQKKGNSEIEYEDALLYKADASVVAISDGATEASFSKCWAQLLVREAIENPPESTYIDQTWIQKATDKLMEQINVDVLPWYAQSKFLEQGAFATLLLLELYKDQRKFRVISIGDSCLFYLQDYNELHSYPMRSHEEFTNNPYLISSINKNNKDILEKQQSNIFDIPFGRTKFFLMTDSLAQWVLKESAKSKGKKPLHFLSGIKDNNQFKEIMYTKIQEGEIRNDDLTFIMLETKVDGVEYR